MAKAVVTVAVLWALWALAQGPEQKCAEWSFECPAVAVKAEPNYAG